MAKYLDSTGLTHLWEKISGKFVSAASGDEYVSAGVEKDKNYQKIKVGATTALTNAVDKANNSVQDVTLDGASIVGNDKTVKLAYDQSITASSTNAPRTSAVYSALGKKADKTKTISKIQFIQVKLNNDQDVNNGKNILVTYVDAAGNETKDSQGRAITSTIKQADWKGGISKEDRAGVMSAEDKKKLDQIDQSKANGSATSIELTGNVTGTANVSDNKLTVETTISNGAVLTDKIADFNVTTAKIGQNAVTTAKILDGAVITTKINDKAVTTDKIADSNVTTAKIADSNVTTDKINDAAVTTAKIADSNVTTNKINDAAVTTAKIADSNVTTAKIADSNVTTAKIKDAAVTNDKIAIGITASKISGVLSNATISAARVDLANGDETVEDAIKSLKGSISGGTFFKGVVDALPAKTSPDYKNGDIVAISQACKVEAQKGKEYIYSGTAGAGEWIELGDSTADQQRLTALENGTKAAGKAKKIDTNDKIGGSTTPVYITSDGTVTAGTALGASAYHDNDYFATGAEGDIATKLGGYFTGGNSDILDEAHGGTGQSDLSNVTVGKATNADHLANALTIKVNGQKPSAKSTGEMPFNGEKAKSFDIGEGNNIKLQWVQNGDANTECSVRIDATDTITSGSSGNIAYLTVTNTNGSDNTKTITITPDVNTDISTATTNDRKLADDVAVKSYVDDHNWEPDDINGLDEHVKNVTVKAANCLISDGTGAPAGTKYSIGNNTSPVKFVNGVPVQIAAPLATQESVDNIVNGITAAGKVSKSLSFWAANGHMKDSYGEITTPEQANKYAFDGSAARRLSIQGAPESGITVDLRLGDVSQAYTISVDVMGANDIDTAIANAFKA